jgi:glycosyltransferase involved in cell wall biosynthesis
MSAAGVDVVVPCHNYGRYLRECVGSVLAQCGVDLRVLIIDDASTDDSARIAAGIAATDPRVELRRHPVNVGHIPTYNEGLAWAARDYTVLLDADDVLTPGALQRACALMEQHPRVGFAYGRALIVRGDGRPPPARGGRGWWRVWPGSRWLERRCRTAENPIHSPEVVVRTRLLRAVGGYRDELPHTADLEMWMRLAVHADVGYVVGPHQAYYRDHPAGMRRRRFGTTLAELGQFCAAFEVLFRDQGGAMADRERLEELARRGLARRALRAAVRSYDRGRADPAQVSGLEALAASVYDRARDVVEARGLRWRKRLGPGVCRAVHPFLLGTHARRVRRELGRRLERAGL